MRVLVPFGTRPEIVKLAPVVRQLDERGFEARTVATGQHYDASLTDVFYDFLGVRPSTRWELEGSEGERVGRMLALAFAEVGRERPDAVLVLGDTYTVPVFCQAARRHAVPVLHLEAGLRSFNETSMEEVNRRVAAALSSVHLAPTDLAARFLAREGIGAERVRVVGNPVVDCLRLLGPPAVPLERRDGVLVTVHRAGNVDDPRRLSTLVELLPRLAREVGPVVFPLHPRTRARLDETGLLDRLHHGGVEVLDPVPYFDMLTLVSRAKVIVTDSGGLQEEAAWYRVPVVVLRRSTPRWEGVEAGTSVLTGMDGGLALDAAARLAGEDEQRRVSRAPCPYGDGHTAERVCDVLVDPVTAPLLRLEEPDFVGRDVPR